MYVNGVNNCFNINKKFLCYLKDNDKNETNIFSDNFPVQMS